MSATPAPDHRSSPRIEVGLPISLVLAAPDGPVVIGGRTTDVGLGGCRVTLSRPVQDDHESGVVVVDLGGEEVAMLVAPVRLDCGPTRDVSLRFVAPTEPDTTWSDHVEELGGGIA